MARLSKRRVSELDSILRHKYGLEYNEEQLQEAGDDILRMAMVKQLWNDVLDEVEQENKPTNTN